MRGDVHGITLTGGRGHEQRGRRYVVVVQSDELFVSTWLVAPTTTSASAAPALFRPSIELLGETSRVLCEQTRAVDPERLGDVVGRVTHHELALIERGLRLVLDL